MEDAPQPPTTERTEVARAIALAALRDPEYLIEIERSAPRHERQEEGRVDG